MNTAEGKREIRERMADLRRRLTEEERQEASRRLRERLTSLPLWTEARVLAAFWPLGKEPDIAPLLRLWAGQGKTLALPRVEGPNPSDIHLYRVADPDTGLAPGTLGILEPDLRLSPPCSTEALDWIWVPGVAFDLGCARLGRGKAYYDSLLSRIPRGTRRTGIAYDWQIVDAPLARDPWDEMLDSVATDLRFIPAPSQEVAGGP